MMLSTNSSILILKPLSAFSPDFILSTMLLTELLFLIRIPVDISDQLKRITVRLDQNRFVTPPEKRSVINVPSVISLGIQAVQVSHGSGQVGIRCFDKQVVMIGHQAIGCNIYIEHFGKLFQNFHKGQIIILSLENLFPAPASVHYVVPCARILNS